MEQKFVAVNDWCHELLRKLTRCTPLKPFRLADGTATVQYCIRPELLPETYFTLVGCHTLDGLPLEQLRLGCWRVRESSKLAILKAAAGFDATRLDRRCWGDLRPRPDVRGTALLSGELLVFGAGALRGPSLHRGHAAIPVPRQNVVTRIWGLRPEGYPLPEIRKRVYESTNVIYGDTLGELEQLWDRRADTAFLDHVARALTNARQWARLPVSRHPPSNAAAVLSIHRRSQAIWKSPPSSGRVLLRRIEFILDHTVIPTSPSIPVSRGPLKPRSEERFENPQFGTGSALN